MSEISFVRDLSALRVIADPLRVRLVNAAADRPITVKEMATTVGIPSGKLYYHVDLLERHGFLVVDSTRLVCGITERVYRAASKDIRVDSRLFGGSVRGYVDAPAAGGIDVTRDEFERSQSAGSLDVDADPTSLRSALVRRTQLRLEPDRALELRAKIDELIEAAEAQHLEENDCVFNLTVAYFPVAQPEGEDGEPALAVRTI
jgi:DNA-binding transcriptional ArsR family regulator